MNQNKENISNMLTEIRHWQRDWDNHLIGERGKKLKTADELVEELSTKYTVTLNDQ